MKTTPEALKALYQTLGGSSGNVAGESKTTGILNKIAALFGSTATAEKIPDAIGNINAVASGITKPSGKKSITTTAETNVADYATAQISDANLVAGNIKKDVAILGVTGSYEGGGSSDFSTATVTFIGASSIEEVNINVACLEEEYEPFVPHARSNGEFSIYPEDETQIDVILYKGQAILTYSGATSVELSGNISIVYENVIITGDGSITFS